MDEIEIPDELLARHLAGAASPEDKVAIQHWLDQSSAHREEYQRLVAAWRAESSREIRDPEPPRLGAARPSPANAGPRNFPAPEGHGRWQSPFYRVAAGLVLLTGTGVVWLISQRGDPPTVYTTGATERRELTLSDGSSVLLAPRSTLTVPVDFGKGTRLVRLVGQAWFSATHDANVPLTVAAASYAVRDAGTVFTVRAREGEPVEVAVIEGAVTVRLARQLTTTERPLGPGDVGRFGAVSSTDTSMMVVVSGRPVDSLSSWRRGLLEVTEAQVGGILKELTRWYGTPITLADSSLATRRVSASLSMTSQEDALNTLGRALKLSPVRSGEGIVLR